MESPFAKTSTVVMYLEPILDSYSQTYVNVLTFSTMPPGPIARMVKNINPPRLSQFQTVSNWCGNPNTCIPVLCRYPIDSPAMNIKNCNTWMGADDIPSVLSFLVTSGYKVDTSLTKMMNTSKMNIMGNVSDNRPSGNRAMVCFFTYIHSGE